MAHEYLLGCLVTCGLFAADGGQPRIIQDQIDAVVPALTMHRSAYARSVNAENDKLVKGLYEAMEQELKAGRLESVLVLKEALAKARDGSLIEPYINPTVSDLLGEFFAAHCRTVVYDPLKMDSWDTSLMVLPPFRIEKPYVKFHSGGGFEIRLPTSGRMSVTLQSDVVPVDIGKFVFDESVVFAQHWSSIQSPDGKPVQKLTLTINMSTGHYAVSVNERVVVASTPIPVAVPKTVRFIDDGNAAYGSRITSIVIRSMMPTCEEEPSRF